MLSIYKSDRLLPSPDEVAELLEVPLEWLLDPDAHREKVRVIRGCEVQVPYYHFHEHEVWGATAMVLSELEQRLLTVIRERSKMALESDRVLA